MMRVVAAVVLGFVLGAVVPAQAARNDVTGIVRALNRIASVLEACK